MGLDRLGRTVEPTTSIHYREYGGLKASDSYRSEVATARFADYCADTQPINEYYKQVGIRTQVDDD